jgi:hypothetical protein
MTGEVRSLASSDQGGDDGRPEEEADHCADQPTEQGFLHLVLARRTGRRHDGADGAEHQHGGAADLGEMADLYEVVEASDHWRATLPDLFGDRPTTLLDSRQREPAVEHHQLGDLASLSIADNRDRGAG